MRKRFISKKRHRFKYKYLVYIVLLYLVYQLVIFLSTNIKLVNSNEEFIKHLLVDSNYHLLYKENNNNIYTKIFNLVSGFNIKKPITILESGFNYENKEEMVYNDTYENIEELEKITGYVEDPNPVDIDNPKVYIYNSHQLENYSMDYLEPYNITPNVMMASYLLKEKLNNLNIPTIAEESNITEFMKINNWKHADSYKASRFYIIDAMNKYQNLDLIIDLHRDALSKSASTVEINGKNYAKVLFVVGLEHDNYQKNLDLANKINDIVKEKYPTLTRGIITKKGATVDGIYNQDLSEKMILLEVGGQNNSIDEVLNTIEAMSLVLKEYLNED